MGRLETRRSLLASGVTTLVFVALCGAAAANEGLRTFQDMAGRSVTIPVQIAKVFSVGPPGTVLMYTLAPELLIGWNTPLTEAQKAFIPREYQALPALGGWAGNRMASLEEIIKAQPDVIISVGEITPFWISNADRVQEQTGIPVALFSLSLESMDTTYRLIGELVNKRERAEELAAYCRAKLDHVRRIAAQERVAQPTSLFYASGAQGLETTPKGSFHAQAIDFVGAQNVADIGAKGGIDRSEISLEQLIAWNPSLILVDPELASGEEAVRAILIAPEWQPIRAVKDRNVLAIPRVPFNWLGRPPSVNQLLGILWLANALYEDTSEIDIEKETREFFLLFYHHALSEPELTALLRQPARAQR